MIICKICNKEFSALQALSKHINFIHHIDKLTYYNTYLLKSPLDGYCATCGKPTTFRGLLGYKTHCNNICAQKDPKILVKIHTENHEKHVSEGVRRSYNKETQIKRIETTKKNNILRYGVENVAQKEDVKEKFKNTLKQQKEQFCKEHNCIPRQTLIKLYGQDWLKLNIPQLKLGRVSFIENKYIPSIEKYSSKSSTFENIIYNFIDTIYDGPIIRHNRPYFLNGRELDIYLPELNLAIEFNGNYFHCFGNTVGVQDKYYHYNKSKECWMNGIRLIHIFEFENLSLELYLLKSLIYYGFDRYNKNNPNKNWNYDSHKPEIIGYYNNIYPIYSA